MSQENLATYIQDHLAGAVAGLETVGHLIDISTDSAEKAFFAELWQDIEEDEKTLRGFLAQTGVEPSVLRQAAAWWSEKVAQIKFKLAGSQPGGLGRLEAMEVLTMGITGKLSLWESLVFSDLPGDWKHLQARAKDQLARLDPHRLAAARAALTPA
jgi:hypothetical protein